MSRCWTNGACQVLPDFFLASTGDCQKGFVDSFLTMGDGSLLSSLPGRKPLAFWPMDATTFDKILRRYRPLNKHGLANAFIESLLEKGSLSEQELVQGLEARGVSRLAMERCLKAYAEKTQAPGAEPVVSKPPASAREKTARQAEARERCSYPWARKFFPLDNQLNLRRLVDAASSRELLSDEAFIGEIIEFVFDKVAFLELVEKKKRATKKKLRKKNKVKAAGPTGKPKQASKKHSGQSVSFGNPMPPNRTLPGKRKRIKEETVFNPDELLFRPTYHEQVALIRKKTIGRNVKAAAEFLGRPTTDLIAVFEASYEGVNAYTALDSAMVELALNTFHQWYLDRYGIRPGKKGPRYLERKTNRIASGAKAWSQPWVRIIYTPVNGQPGHKRR